MGYGKKLAALRGKKTQEEVANAIGISPSAYAMYEREERRPRDSIKIKLAKYFNSSIQHIFFDD